jgi:hypothetical protein
VRGHVEKSLSLSLDEILALPPVELVAVNQCSDNYCGSGATGSRRKAKNPASATPTVSNVVATGRPMNGADGFTLGHPPGHLRRRQY